MAYGHPANFCRAPPNANPGKARWNELFGHPKRGQTFRKSHCPGKKSSRSLFYYLQPCVSGPASYPVLHLESGGLSMPEPVFPKKRKAARQFTDGLARCVTNSRVPFATRRIKMVCSDLGYIRPLPKMRHKTSPHGQIPQKQRNLPQMEMTAQNSLFGSHAPPNRRRRSLGAAPRHPAHWSEAPLTPYPLP